ELRKRWTKSYKTTTLIRSCQGENLKMKKLLNFKRIRTKILLGFSIVLVLAILLSAYSIYSIQKTNSSMQDMIDKEIALLITDEQLANNMSERTGMLRGL